MQEAFSYNPTNPDLIREILLQLLADSERQVEKYRKILQYFSTEANSFFNLQQLQVLLNYNNIPNHSNKAENIWAFWDVQNLWKTLRIENWRINWQIFREYLASEYGVTRVIGFWGNLKENEPTYNMLRKAGIELKLREIEVLPNKEIKKGNCDVDLCAYALNFKQQYDKAIIIANDGDYSLMLKMLQEQNKLKFVLSPHSVNRTSKFIKNAIGVDSILSIQSIREIIEYKR